MAKTTQSLLTDSFSDPKLAAQVLGRIRDLAARMSAIEPPSGSGGVPFSLMEVCGTHSHVLGRSGIRELLKDTVEYRSGPGCPVCVTDPADLDLLIRLSREKDPILVMFGDLLAVPGTEGSLLEQRARGARISLVYSSFDALDIARRHPREEVVFVGTGFETTAPGTALLLKEAKTGGLNNFSVISLHKLMPPVLGLLLSAGRCRIGGLILPGHVAAVTGRLYFDFVGSGCGYPAIIAGFEPLDLLHATARLLETALQRDRNGFPPVDKGDLSRPQNGSPKVENGYSRVVGELGNTVARQIMEEVFLPEAALWRGFGLIEGSGLKIRSPYARFDARERFGLPPASAAAPLSGSECRCGEVLRGEITPPQCPLFARSCTPDHPRGACMVSSEGACSSYF